MATFNEKVVLILESINKTQKELGRYQEGLQNANLTNKQVVQNTQRLERSLDQLNSKAAMTQQSFDSFRGVMGLNNQAFAAFVNSGREFETVGGRMAASIRESTAGLHGFRMELLSTLFFGASLMGLFGGMLIPSANLFGIFDLFGTLLEVTFLPIMQDLFEIFMQFFGFVLSWDEDTRKLVGTVVVLAAAFGGFLFVTSQIRLGVAGLIQDFGEMDRTTKLLRISLLALPIVALTTDVDGLTLVYAALALQMAELLLLMAPKTWTDNLKKIGSAFTALWLRILGPLGLILAGLMLIDDFTTSSLEKQGKQYKNTWARIVGVVFDAIGSILGIIGIVPSFFAEAGELAWKAFKAGLFGEDFNFGAELDKAISNFQNTISMPQRELNKLKEDLGLVIDIPDTTPVGGFSPLSNKISDLIPATQAGGEQNNTLNVNVTAPITGNASQTDVMLGFEQASGDIFDAWTRITKTNNQFN